MGETRTRTRLVFAMTALLLCSGCSAHPIGVEQRWVGGWGREEDAVVPYDVIVHSGKYVGMRGDTVLVLAKWRAK